MKQNKNGVQCSSIALGGGGGARRRVARQYQRAGVVLRGVCAQGINKKKKMISTMNEKKVVLSETCAVLRLRANKKSMNEKK